MPNAIFVWGAENNTNGHDPITLQGWVFMDANDSLDAVAIATGRCK